MCGRARCSLRVDDIPRSCHRSTGPSCIIDMDRYRPSYNVSPGFNLPVIRREDGAVDNDGYAIQCMRWGLVPSFTKKSEKPDFYRMFNARSESIGEKASFRRLLPKNRCLVAVEGFYEWKKDGSKKQPYHIHFKDGRPLVFAALYDSWKNSEGEILHTFTIVTTSSSSALQWLHDRMPVILGDKEATDTWLNGSPLAKFDVVLKPYEDADLVWYPVTPAMGKPSFDGPECIKEVHFKPEDKRTISKFFTRKSTHPKEEESEPEKSGTLNKSVNSALSETVKQEPGNDEKLEVLSVAKVGDQTLKSDPSNLSHGDEKSRIRKWDHMELGADPKLNTDNSSPARKKTDHKGGGDKQPTLFSFFGKK